MIDALAEAKAVHAGRMVRRRPRRGNPDRAEGRWALIEPAKSGEASFLSWIDVLLERYGILTRELVELETWAPAWADLAPLLARAELRGELRRGFFVEGFSGVQYATDEAADGLSRLAGSSIPAVEDILLAAADPANLYGSGAPLDIPLLDGGTGRLSRVAGNFLVMKNGRPLLVIEGYGKRLTGLASASRSEIRSALARVVELAGPRRPVLKVETYNGEPALQSPVAARLVELGFVRDFPGMTYYQAWAGNERQSRSADG